ncbi:hypothetical protein AAHB37_04915 [Glutamicibacter halophytocola]
MGIADDAVEIRARGWRTLASLHGLIDAALEKDLTAQVGLSVVEYTLLDALNRQDGWHMRMAQPGPRHRTEPQRNDAPGHEARRSQSALARAVRG